MDAIATNSKVNQQTQEMLVKNYAFIVKRMAYHLLGRLPYSIQLDDLIQEGMLGLLEAVRHYDATKGASFETYAGIRIRGHMLDELRRNDWVPRSVYRNARTISEAVRKVENRLGREAKDQEIAQELNIRLEEYHEMVKDSLSNPLYGFDDVGVTDDVLKMDSTNVSSEPQTNILQEDLRNQIARIIANLPKKERLVLLLYYERDLNLKEIGEVLGVSESRISQILNQATVRTRARLLK